MYHDDDIIRQLRSGEDYRRGVTGIRLQGIFVILLGLAGLLALSGAHGPGPGMLILVAMGCGVSGVAFLLSAMGGIQREVRSLNGGNRPDTVLQSAVSSSMMRDAVRWRSPEERI